MSTLEILAHYLPYGIRVASQWGDGSDNTTGILLGIATTAERPVIWADGKANYTSSYANVLPVLRSFADLCTPLEDGTVPAVEFAKLCLGDEVGWKKEYAHYDPKEEEEEEDYDSHLSEEVVNVGGKDEWEPDNRISFTIYPDWTWYGHGRHENYAPAAAIDYLRSKHFAVGLMAGEYIRKA